MVRNPLYTDLHDPIPKPNNLQNSQYQPLKGKSVSQCEQEVAGAEGPVLVQVPFSITDIQQCKEKLESYFKNPRKFSEAFQTGLSLCSVMER
ncbi:hypothetical protein AAY473_024155 [Plecturocebus cupreus]